MNVSDPTSVLVWRETYMLDQRSFVFESVTLAQMVELMV